MTQVWLLWGDDDSPVAAFASRESAEKAALFFGEELNRLRALSGGEIHPIKRNDHGDYTSFWVGGSNVSAIAPMEVQP